MRTPYIRAHSGKHEEITFSSAALIAWRHSNDLENFSCRLSFVMTGIVLLELPPLSLSLSAYIHTYKYII